ncbi:MAG: hypothetical protein H6Q73_3480 [Firmicutes bacterium]|nr:hypothetical protein [Bacillota bacterium]
MIQGIVAVEPVLTPVIELLETEGYEVVELDEANVQAVDAVIVSGADKNLMNIQDVLTEAPVIIAAGKTAEEVLEELEDRL